MGSLVQYCSIYRSTGMPAMLLNPNAVILFALVLYAGLYLLAI